LKYDKLMAIRLSIFFGTVSDGLSAELTGEDEALRKCPVDIFSERASMRRERQGA